MNKEFIFESAIASYINGFIEEKGLLATSILMNRNG